MPHETVPADIAAAIEAFDSASRETHEDDRKAHAALNAAILKHLREAAEMNVALERIEQGVRQPTSCTCCRSSSACWRASLSSSSLPIVS